MKKKAIPIVSVAVVLVAAVVAAMLLLSEQNLLKRKYSDITEAALDRVIGMMYYDADFNSSEIGGEYTYEIKELFLRAADKEPQALSYDFDFSGRQLSLILPTDAKEGATPAVSMGISAYKKYLSSDEFAKRKEEFKTDDFKLIYQYGEFVYFVRPDGKEVLVSVEDWDFDSLYEYTDPEDIENKVTDETGQILRESIG